MHAFVAAVHEHVGAQEGAQSRKEVTRWVLNSGLVEHHPRDRALIRLVEDSGEFWDSLCFTDSMFRLGG